MYMSHFSLSLSSPYIYVLYYIYILSLFINHHFVGWLINHSTSPKFLGRPWVQQRCWWSHPPPPTLGLWEQLGESWGNHQHLSSHGFISFPSCVFSGVSMCFLTSVVHLASDVRKGKDGRERRSKTKQNLKSTSQQLLLHLLLPSFSNIESRQCHARHKITEDRASTKDR